MVQSPRWLPLTTLVGAALILTACPAPAPEDGPPATDPVVEDPAAPQERRLYEARLEAVGGSGVTGTATLTIDGDRLQVTVVAGGFDPDARVPQHVHMNATCDQPGGILLNLDDQVSAANESEARGDHYPQADENGELEYEVSRSLDDLESALLAQQGPGLEDLDLGNRVVNLHGANMQAIACGPLEARS